MSKQTESSVVAEPESKSKTDDKNLDKRWNTLIESGLGVSQIICQTLPGHPGDEACKTKLVVSPDSIINHLPHGGGFQLTIRDGGVTWAGWQKLKDAGVWIQWIRDEVTDHYIDINDRIIKNRLKPHNGKFRGAYQAFRNQFLFSLSKTKPEPGGDAVYNDNFDEQ